MSADAVVAGRLEIPVESDTKGFKETLKKKVESLAKDVDAPVGVKLEHASTKSLRKRLEAQTQESSKGVDAKIGIRVDAKGLRGRIKAAVKAAGPIVVDADMSRFDKSLTQTLQKATKKQVSLSVVGNTQGLQRFMAKVRRITAQNPVNVNVNTPNLPPPQAPTRGGGGGGGAGGGGSSFFKMPGGGMSARSGLMPIAYLGIASIIQPAIAAIVGSLGGLVAMAGSAAAALNVLGGAGGPLLALVAGFSVFKIALGQIQGPLKDVPKAIRFVRTEAEALKKPWEEMKKSVGVAFWAPLKGQIESTGKVAIPILKDGLTGVAQEMGEVSKETAQWLRSPMFKKASGSIFYTMRTVTDGLGAALLGTVKGIVNLTQAAGPMLSKFGDVMRDFGAWSAGIGDNADKQKRLGVAFDYAWRKGAQLWDMTKNLGAALKEMFSAGRTSGDSLLGALQDVIREWRTWAESTEGQERIKRWFDNVEPIARAAGRLIVDLGKAIARLAEDGTTAGLLEKIRTELLPSLETFLRNLGTTLGPAVITFITNVLEILTQMSAAGSPLGQGLGVINQMLSGIAAVMQANPELAKNLGILLGALLGFRALSFFAQIIPGIAQLFSFVKGGGKASWLGAAGGIALFSGALSGLPGPWQGAIAGLSTLLTLLPAFRNFKPGNGMSNLATHIGLMGVAFQETQKKSGGFVGAMKGIGSSLGYGAGAIGGGLKGALSGMMGLLGGPWGLALVGATTAIGAWAQAQQNAKADADALSKTIDAQTGKFTEASEKFVGENLAFNVDISDLDRLKGAGVDVASAAKTTLGDQGQFESYIENLKRIRKESAATTPEVSAAANGLISAMENQRDRSKEAMDAQAAYNAVTGQTKGAADGAAGGVQNLGDKLRGMAPTATEVADALERLSGITLSKREADRRATVSSQALDAALKANGKTHDDNTAKGRANNEALDAYAQAQVAAAEANAQSGASAGELSAHLERARTKLVKAAIQMGYSETEANELATQLRLTGAAGEGMAAKVASVKGKTVIVKVTDQASAVAAAAQRAINQVNGKTVTITSVFQTHGFQASLRAAQAIKNAKAYYGPANGGILTGFADGGIAHFANGGIRGWGKRAEDHIAQIAPAGSWRVWAEDETGGEAYIPLAASKRHRSTAILEEVANRFGMALSPLIEGAGQPAAAGVGPVGRVAGAGAAAREVNFHEGAIQILNPAPETASRSLVSTLRNVGDFGLFGEDD